MRGTVVMATHDHARSIPAVLGELAAAAHELAGDGVRFEVLMVDAGSTDDTIDVARSTSREVGLPVEVLHVDAPAAWVTQRDAFEHALKYSSPDFLVTLDPAGHHDARQLPDLVRSFRSKRSGLTIGSRWARGGTAPGTSLPRSVLSRAASWFVARATGLRRVSDVTTSFRVIRPDAARLVTERPATTGDYGFYCEFAAAVQAYGFTVDEVPISFRPRFAAVPPLELHDLVQFGGDLRRLRARVRAIRQDMTVDQATWAARSGALREQQPEAGSEFGALEELTELSSAGRFTDWIASSLEGALDLRPGNRLLEVGAGLGAISAALAGRHPHVHVTAIEPAANVFPDLRERTSDLTNVSVSQQTSSEVAEGPDRFDAVVYVNVLEHIADDDAELETAAELLRAGGSIGVFVPAMPALYGSLDYKSGHYRRYTAEQLTRLLDRAGYVDIDVRYLDVLGVVPYWAMYRVLDVQRLDRVSSTGYDRVIVPLSRLVQRLVPRPPVGKNLIAVARRPG